MALPPHLPRPREHPDPREPQTLEVRFVISSQTRLVTKPYQNASSSWNSPSACLARAATSSLHDAAARRSRAPTAPARSSAGARRRRRRAPGGARPPARARRRRRRRKLDDHLHGAGRARDGGGGVGRAVEEWVEHRARGADQRPVGRRARGEAARTIESITRRSTAIAVRPSWRAYTLWITRRDICCGADGSAPSSTPRSRPTPRPRSASRIAADV